MLEKEANRGKRCTSARRWAILKVGWGFCSPFLTENVPFLKDLLSFFDEKRSFLKDFFSFGRQKGGIEGVSGDMKWLIYPKKGGPRITYLEPLKRLRLKDMGDLSFWKSGRPADVKSSKRRGNVAKGAPPRDVEPSQRYSEGFLFFFANKHTLIWRISSLFWPWGCEKTNIYQKKGPRITYLEPLKRLRLKDMDDLSFWKMDRPADVKSLESWKRLLPSRR